MAIPSLSCQDSPRGDNNLDLLRWGRRWGLSGSNLNFFWSNLLVKGGLFLRSGLLFRGHFFLGSNSFFSSNLFLGSDFFAGSSLFFRGRFFPFRSNLLSRRNPLLFCCSCFLSFKNFLYYHKSIQIHFNFDDDKHNPL